MNIQNVLPPDVFITLHRLCAQVVPAGRGPAELFSRVFLLLGTMVSSFSHLRADRLFCELFVYIFYPFLLLLLFGLRSQNFSHYVEHLF